MRDDIQPVIEILAELALFDQFGQIRVGGGDDSHIHADGLRAAESLKLALLQHAQQLGLQTERHVADFVQEDGAVIGLLETADAVADGAGKRALHVPEELGFEQSFGKRAAIHGYQRESIASAGGVDGARGQFLAGSGFAGDENGGAARGH